MLVMANDTNVSVCITSAYLVDVSTFIYLFIFNSLWFQFENMSYKKEVIDS